MTGNVDFMTGVLPLCMLLLVAHYNMTHHFGMIWIGGDRIDVYTIIIVCRFYSRRVSSVWRIKHFANGV